MSGPGRKSGPDRMLGLILRVLTVIFFLRFVIRALAAFMRPARRSTPARPPAPLSGELVRDRVCNTFVPRDRALRAVVGGAEEHFCSAACRDKALAS